MIVVIMALALTFVLGYAVARLYTHFCRTRILALSVALESDAVGGIGVSVICPNPCSMDVVIALLDTLYPRTEIIVALSNATTSPLFAQLVQRYSLQSADGQRFYSDIRLFSQLVVVDVYGETEQYAVADIAAKYARYNYLLRVPSRACLLPFAVGRMVAAIASEPIQGVEMVTTTDRDIELLSRDYWAHFTGFGEVKRHPKSCRCLHIAEPLALPFAAAHTHTVIVERSRYNFLDYFAFNIMKYRNKLLSLRKP